MTELIQVNLEWLRQASGLLNRLSSPAYGEVSATSDISSSSTSVSWTDFRRAGSITMPGGAINHGAQRGCRRCAH
jgi:hypothetical protein